MKPKTNILIQTYSNEISLFLSKKFLDVFKSESLIVMITETNLKNWKKRWWRKRVRSKILFKAGTNFSSMKSSVSKVKKRLCKVFHHSDEKCKSLIYSVTSIRNYLLDSSWVSLLQIYYLSSRTDWEICKYLIDSI